MFNVFNDLLDNKKDFGQNLELIVRLAIEKVGSNVSLKLGTRECAMDFLETLVKKKYKLISANP